jgi:hypothetical protein
LLSPNLTSEQINQLVELTMAEALLFDRVNDTSNKLALEVAAHPNTCLSDFFATAHVNKDAIPILLNNPSFVLLLTYTKLPSDLLPFAVSGAARIARYTDLPKKMHAFFDDAPYPIVRDSVISRRIKQFFTRKT